MPRYTADAIRNKEVLVVNIGAGTGTSALVNVPFEFSLKNVALLKPLRAALDGRYLSSCHPQDCVRRCHAWRGTALHGLGAIKSLPIPLPPLPVQIEIVRRIETAFAWIDRLAREAQSARRLIERLHQAILSKGFRGELVPQDPNDEPASVLLERNRAERNGQAGSRRRRGKAARRGEVSPS